MLNFKNQRVEALKIGLDSANAGAGKTAQYEIQGKTHVPTTDTERMFLESDSELFFRSLNAFAASTLLTDSWQIADDGNDNLGFFSPNSAGTEVWFMAPAAFAGVPLISSIAGTVGFGANSTFQILLATGGLFFPAGDFVKRVNGINTVAYGVPSIFGTDNRYDLAASDGAPITLYTTVNATDAFLVSIRIDPTTFAAASTYILRWTEDGAAHAVTLTTAVVNTEVFATLLIQPDAVTAITVQYTHGAGSTDDVSAKVMETD